MTMGGKPNMEKIIIKEDIKGLEEEIDSAVDRLFVEGKNEPEKRLPIKLQRLEPSYPPSSFLKSVEKMETQLLSLEWEISKENLEKTGKEIFALRGIFKEEADISSVLNLMEKVLTEMIEDEEKIWPSQIKFLLDSMQTIKLLMKIDQEDEEIYIYKKLAYAGIEARFSCMEGFKNNKTIPSFLNLIDQPPSGLGPMNAEPLKQSVGTSSLPMDVTIFKVGERLFGMESDKIFKFFKIPNSFLSKYSNPDKIRLKEIEVKMIDLRKIFSIQGSDQKEESKILIVKNNGGYKGWRVAQVLKRLSFHLDVREGLGEYFTGLIHWTHQGHGVEIPILNFEKI